MIFREWHDFVMWPTHPDRVSTADERLDTSYVGADSRDPPEKGSAKLVTQAIIVDEDDDFEQMAVGEFGDITIWTRDKVWWIRRSHGLEKLMELSAALGATRWSKESVSFREDREVIINLVTQLT